MREKERTGEKKREKGERKERKREKKRKQERKREKKREKERKREKRCPRSIIILNFFFKSICQHLISIIIYLHSICKRKN